MVPPSKQSLMTEQELSSIANSEHKAETLTASSTIATQHGALSADILEQAPSDEQMVSIQCALPNEDSSPTATTTEVYVV